jgi:hypothetical protein
MEIHAKLMCIFLISCLNSTWASDQVACLDLIKLDNNTLSSTEVVLKEACLCFDDTRESVLETLSEDTERNKILSINNLDFDRLSNTLRSDSVFPTFEPIIDNLENHVDAKITYLEFPDSMATIDAFAFKSYCENNQYIDTLVFKEILRAAHYNENNTAIFVSNKLAPRSKNKLAIALQKNQIQEYDNDAPLSGQEIELYDKYIIQETCSLPYDLEIISPLPLSDMSENNIKRSLLHTCLKQAHVTFKHKREAKNDINTFNGKTDFLFKTKIQEDLDNHIRNMLPIK